MALNYDKKVDILTKLYEIELTDFDRRRIYEWKFSLGVWTATAAFIALVLRGTFRVSLPEKDFLYLGGALIWVVHAVFLIFITLANDCNKSKARAYEIELNTLTSVNFGDGTEVQKSVNRIKWAKGWWSVPLHLLVSMILLGVAAYLIKTKTGC